MDVRVIGVRIRVTEWLGVDIDNVVAQVGANVVSSIRSETDASKVEHDGSLEQDIVLVVNDVDFTSFLEHLFHVRGFFPLVTPAFGRIFDENIFFNILSQNQAIGKVVSLIQ